MRTSLTWIAAILFLVAIGFLMACSSKYSAANNGLVVVPTQGSAVMQTFNLNLANGHLSQINNANGPPTNGIPASVVLDRAGAFAYMIVKANPAVTNSATGIQTFQVASDGKLAPIGTTTTANPSALAIDSAGKFLFVADAIDGTVSVFSIGSNASLTAVGTPTVLPAQAGGQTASASALAVTPTVYPPLYAPCSGQTPPTTENLYVTDSNNYVLLNYSIGSSGALTLVPNGTTTGIATGSVPSGVAVDPCNRFVYVANSNPNNSVSAYTICTSPSVVPPLCAHGDFSLNPVTGSPFAISPGDGAGPIAVDPYGKSVYVVDTTSSEISAFKISSSNGALTSIGTYATGAGANSIAIRSDDVWVFVANSTSSTLSQYAITPATGTLTPQPTTTTFNIPSGVAVE
jgi:6-phosphogluconolactonase